MTQHGIYDTSTEFTGDLAAKLIAGANDTDCNQDAYKVVLESLRIAYQIALDYYLAISDSDADGKWQSRSPLSDDAIQSADMQRCEGLLGGDPKGGTFSGWLTYRPTSFAEQKFNRAAIQRWLDAKGMVSAYRFAGVKEENTATPAPETVKHDYSLLATREQLLDAFEKWGLKPAWFDDLHGHQWLLDARRIKGQGQRGHGINPMFCPFAVMNGLIESVRKRTRLKPDTAWRVLEHKFPKVYADHECYDPRNPTGD